MSNQGSKTPMTQEAAARIQAANAKDGQDTGKNSFPARAQAAAAANTHGQQQQGGQGGQQKK